MRPILALRGVAVLVLALSASSLTTACGQSVVESRILSADFDTYKSGAIEVEPTAIEGGAKSSEQFLAYLQAELQKAGILEPLPADQGAQLIVRVRAAANTQGEDDARVVVDFVDGRTRQTLGQITVPAGAADKTGASIRNVGDKVVAYMRAHRHGAPAAKAGHVAAVVTPPSAAGAASAGAGAAVATSGSCKTTCTPDATSALPPEDLTRLVDAFQPMLKDVRICLDRISAQAIQPAVILRFESQPGQLTHLKLDAGGYDDMQCVVDAQARPPRVTVARASSVRCEYRCTK